MDAILWAVIRRRPRTSCLLNKRLSFPIESILVNRRAQLLRPIQLATTSESVTTVWPHTLTGWCPEEGGTLPPEQELLSELWSTRMRIWTRTIIIWIRGEFTHETYTRLRADGGLRCFTDTLDLVWVGFLFGFGFTTCPLMDTVCRKKRVEIAAANDVNYWVIGEARWAV